MVLVLMFRSGFVSGGGVGAVGVGGCVTLRQCWGVFVVRRVM